MKNLSNQEMEIFFAGLLLIVTSLPTTEAIAQFLNRNTQDTCPLDLTPRTIYNKLKKVNDEGVATLGIGRKDKGQFRISEQWANFIIATYDWGQRDGSRMNRN